jgi:gibberellin A4 carboxyl methyltransferase
MSAQKTPAPASPVTHATTTGMTGGGFYNQNSTPQWDATAAILEHLEVAADALPIDGNGPVCLADFGCSEGRNSIAALSRPVTRLVRRTDRPIQTIHSDLPTNDFSSLLRSLRPEGHSVFGHPNVYSSVVGGSMYDQLLPDRSLHMATTFNAIGFLSRKPIATLPGYIFPNGPSVVRNNGFVTEEDQAAFSELARKDIATFLRARAKELVPGGKLLLQVFGANETASTCDGIYDLLNDAVLCFVEDGSISKDVYETYYQPVYMRTLEELTGPVSDPALDAAGLFQLDHATSYEIPGLLQ